MKNEFINNRHNLFDKLDNNSIAIICSGYIQHRTADAIYDFVVNNNFYYLTGIDQDNVTLVIAKMNNQYFEYLFLEPTDEMMAKWVGWTLTKEEASNVTGINVVNIFDNAAFKAKTDGMYQSSRYGNAPVSTVYLDLERHDYHFYKTFGLNYAKYLQEEFPSVTIKNCYDMIINQRMVKNQSEIDLISESIQTTKRAIELVMTNHQKLSNEAIAMAYHDWQLTAENKVKSFGDIIAAGKNATTLHYEDNNSPIEDNSLLLMDVGCYTKHYSSDITRTFPVSGKFTKRQKEVYAVVLDTNKKCIEYAKAGMSWQDINNYAKSLLAAGCKKLGLIKEDHELVKYYFHSIGHSLGLDVHDPSHFNQGLVEGMVITIEPGLYIPEENIGIRIEDNIVITKGKAKCLSSDIIKEIDDIEKFLK